MTGYRLAFFVTLTFVCGCDVARPIDRPAAVPNAAPRRDHLATLVELLDSLESSGGAASAPQLTYELNRWLEQFPGLTDWQPDPLIDRLPSTVRNSTVAQQFDAKAFTDQDTAYFQESRWLRSIARQLMSASPDERMSAWCQQQQPPLTPQQRTDLLIAERLFDWVVRNIQLDAMLPSPDDAEKPATAGEAEPTPSPRPSLRALPGPGYTQATSESLLFGRGDAWQRARLLILLARQCDIDVVMLAFQEGTGPGPPRPWLPAVLIGPHLYLFDGRLGMPIPGPGQQGVATLQQVLDDIGLLRQLDMGAELTYPVQQADLQRLVALIDADPAALSWRMAALERQLSGDAQMRLTTQPSITAAGLGKHPGIADVQLWTVPFDVVLYRQAVQAKAATDPETRRQLAQRSAMFLQLPSLAEGRRLHLQGVYSNREISAEQAQVVGAKQLYMQCMTSERRIADLDTSSQLQQAMGFEPLPGENQQMWQMRLEAGKQLLRQATDAATYWMGLVHYESGNYSAAAQWLTKVVEAESPSQWLGGARYNLGRTHEQLGQWEEAQRMYRADVSPQQHGSLLRARDLRLRTEAGQQGDASTEDSGSR